jgi:drug/metabolite transporter (DMT)-like permease
MTSTSIVCGFLLILIGIIGYGYGYANGSASLTALIPALLGVILAALGAAAQAKEDLRKHLMHGALLIALIGFLATVSSFLKLPTLIDGSALRPAAVVAQFATAVVCLAFLILGIRSFIDARRNRAV